jgi:hypothetical protein
MGRILLTAASGFACAAAAASLDAAQIEAVRAAYKALASADIEARPAAALPADFDYERIDVSSRMRSASFGHTTTLLVAVPRAAGDKPSPSEFWVEYGKSTNFPARLFGPFPVKP